MIDELPANNVVLMVVLIAVIVGYVVETMRYEGPRENTNEQRRQTKKLEDSFKNYKIL